MSFETGILRPPGRSAPGCRSSSCSRSGSPHAELCTPEGLARIDEYADGIGPHKSLVLPRDPSGAIGEPSSLVRDAHRLWLTVHVWTVRLENRFLPTNLRAVDGPKPPATWPARSARCSTPASTASSPTTPSSRSRPPASSTSDASGLSTSLSVSFSRSFAAASMSASKRASRSRATSSGSAHSGSGAT